ncbi:MAG: major capsid protein [Microviridae sp.]|nr:MAG: major capsid protein [Microviridae sp.]
MDKQTYSLPAPLARSRRREDWRGLTSVRAGVINPIGVFALLREDSIRGTFMCQVRMEEAVRTIINPVRVKMQAHLVSKYVFERFNGSMETLNRSYMGEKMPDGSAAPPWYLREAMPGNDTGHALFDKMGIHYSATADVNSDVTEAYNAVVNYRRANVSKALPARLLTDTTLARAFWPLNKVEYIKPTFDAAMLETLVPLYGEAPVTGILVNNATATVPFSGAFRETGAASTQTLNVLNANQATTIAVEVLGATAGAAWPAVYANLQASGVGFSMASMRMAQDAVVLAKMRQRYTGIPDEYLIDLLMQGIRVPPEDFKLPVLIAEAETVIGQTARYATDGASLDQSVTNGVAALRFNINTPPVNQGGYVVVTLEIVPEQLMERQEDWSIYYYPDGTASWLPDATRDGPDPQKVEAVTNSFVDVLHGTPDGLFGYAPLNHGWNRSLSRVGGRYKRPVPDAFVEDRQRIWTVDKVNPTLSTDFYLCPSPFPHTPFADQAADPFEVITIGQCVVTGLTVFGTGFEEDDDHYEKIMAKIDQSRLTGQGGPALVEGEEASTIPAVLPVEEGEAEE